MSSWLLQHPKQGFPLQGWAEKFSDAMVEFDQMLFIFQHRLPCGPHTSSIGIATLGFLWYRGSHPGPHNSPQLQIWPHHWSDTTSQSSVFLCWGPENSQMVPNQENIINQLSAKLQSCTAAIATTDLCAGALSWWNITPFFSFPGHFEMSLVLIFKVLNYLSSVGLSGRKQCS